MPDDELTDGHAAELYEHISREGASRNLRIRRLRIVVLALAGVILLSGAGFSVYIGVSSLGASHRAEQGTYLGLLPTTWQPRVSGPPASNEKAVSLAEAKAQADIRVLAPSDDAVPAAIPDLIAGAPATQPAANGDTPPDTTVRVIWLDHQGAIGAPGDVVHIEYNHLEITEVRMDSSWNGPRSYRGMVEQQADPGAYIGTVQDSTAYIAPPNDDQGSVHPGYLMYTNGNVQIIVEGYYPADDLVVIADSLH